MLAKRLASPEEKRSAASWLLSDGASYVTGAVVHIGREDWHIIFSINDIEDKSHLPVYGHLPHKAKLKLRRMINVIIQINNAFSIFIVR